MTGRPSDLAIPTDLPARFLISWTRLLVRRRLLLTIFLIIQAIVFSSLSAWILWQPDILTFFSADSAEVQAIHKAQQQPGPANLLRFDIHLKSAPHPGDSVELATAAGDLAARLQKDASQFRFVWGGGGGDSTIALATAYQHLVAQAPLLMTDADLAALETQLTPEQINARFANVRNHLADPDGELLLHQLMSDPLNLSAIAGARLRSIAPTGSAESTLQNGMLTTRDKDNRLHAMIIAEAISLPSDQKAAEATLAAANAAVASVRQAHPDAEVWTVGAHRGYVENARRIITDVTRISALGSVAVAVAIGLYFRRLTTALLCMIPPIVGVGLALGLAGIFHVTLPLILLGFAGLLCGSTTDYGILIIAESRRLFAGNQNRWHADIPAIAARHMLGPITMSVATSVTGFAALALSSSPGLCALGLFVAAATLCIWLITFLILPAYLGSWILESRKKTTENTENTENTETTQRKSAPSTSVHSVSSVVRSRLALPAAILFLALTVYLAIPALHIRFNTNPHSLDGSTPAARYEEEAFAKTWGDFRNRGVVLVTKPTAEAVLHANQQVHDYLQDQQHDGLLASFISVAPILPDEETVRSRSEAWQKFWTPARRDRLRALLAAAATSNRLKPASFTAYADRVATLEIPSAQDRLADSLAARLPGLVTTTPTTPTSVTLATLVQMLPESADVSVRRTVAWAPELRARLPDTLVLSGRLLFIDATDRSRADGEHLGPWCLIAILLPLVIYFRSLRRAWLAMLCLIIGFLWVLAAAALGGGGLNLLSLVPILFTLGVAVDYGIYAATDPASSSASQRRPVFLCALTTILGTGSLILAGHPALRWLGLTLVAGITGGYLTSHFLVGPLARRACQGRNPTAENTGNTENSEDTEDTENTENTETTNGKIKSSTSVLSVSSVVCFSRRLASVTVVVFLLIVTAMLFIPPVTEILLARQKPADTLLPATVPVVQLARHTFESGSNWMRYRSAKSDSAGGGLWEIYLKGDPAVRGAAIRDLAAPIDVRIESEMLDQLDTLLPNEFSRFLITRTFAANLITLPDYIPLEYQKEIYASAPIGHDPRAYLAPTYSRILSYHALHDVSQMLIDNPLIVPDSFACTGIVSLPSYSAAQNGHLYLARNFDFEGGESFSRQKSLTYIIPPQTGPDAGIPFAHVAWPGLAGCVTGINQQKIALFLNAAATADFRRIGTPTILMAREILEHARSLDDAEKIIARTQTFVSDIIVVADGKTGQARIFEKSPARFAAYDITGATDSAVVANHLVTPTFANDSVNRSRIDGSTTSQRYARARQLLDRLHNNITPATLASLLRDKQGINDQPLGLGNRNAIDGLIACHSVIIDVTAGQMWIAAWPCAEGEYLGIDVAAMLPPDSAVDGQNTGLPPSFAPSASPPSLPMDTIMTDGSWQQFVASRHAAREAEQALRCGHAAQAIEWADGAIRDNPGFFLGYELRGRAELLQGNKSAAQRDLKHSLDLNPPYAKRRRALEDLIKQCDTH